MGKNYVSFHTGKKDDAAENAGDVDSSFTTTENGTVRQRTPKATKRH